MDNVEAKYEYKATFVANYLKPLLLAVGENVIDVKYVNSATVKELDPYFQLDAYGRVLAEECEDKKDDSFSIKGEWVILTFRNAYSRGINVNCDSLSAIVRDVFKHLST